MQRDLSDMANEVFPADPDGGMPYPAVGQQRVLSALQRDVAEGRHLLCLAGPDGSGKTSLLRALRQSFEHGLVGLIEQPTPHRLLVDVAKALQLDTAGGNETLLRRRLVMLLLMAEQRHQPIILIVDDAERLSTEDIELLLHFFPSGHATLVLAGTGFPETWLAGCMTSAGAAHIDHCHPLEPLSAQETAGYIRQRLRVARLPEDLFAPAAIEAIHRQSEGLPGHINRLSAGLLAHAAAQGQDSVSVPVVEQSLNMESGPSEGDAAAETPTAPMPVRRRRSVLPVRSVVAPSASQYVSEPLPKHARRLQRRLRLWRSVAILASIALVAVLTREVWIDRLPSTSVMLAGLAGLRSDPPTPATPSGESGRSPVPDATAVPAEPAAAGGQKSDFAALDTPALMHEDVASPRLPAMDPSAGVPMPGPTATVMTSPESAYVPGGTLPADAVKLPAPASERQDDAGSLSAPPDPVPEPAPKAAPPPAKEPSPQTRTQRMETARLYAKRAEYEWRNGDLQAASVSIQRGLSSDPGNPRLLEMRTRLQEILQRP